MMEVTKTNLRDLMTLEEIILSNDNIGLTAFLENLLPVELSRTFFNLSKENQIRLLELLGPEKSAALISKISGLGARTIVEQLPHIQSIQILKEMSSDQQANVLRKIGEENAEAILEEIKPEEAKKTRELMSYSENTAGALMITEYLAYTSYQQVGDV